MTQAGSFDLHMEIMFLISFFFISVERKKESSELKEKFSNKVPVSCLYLIKNLMYEEENNFSETW